MAVPKDVKIPGSQFVMSFPAAGRIAFGAAIVGSGLTEGAETLVPATAQEKILGLAGKRNFVPRGDYDGFYETYEMVDVVSDYGMALVTPNGGNYNIDLGDFLEVAALGDGSTSSHGILEEAGTHDGTLRTLITVAKALAAVSMGSKSYKVPASDVAVGDMYATMDAGAIATMGLSVGDYILLEDLSAELQVNKVASLTATRIYFVIPSTVSLVHTADADLITRLYQVPVALER